MAARTLRQKNFDARQYHDEAYDLARANPAALAKSVTQLARKKNAQDGALDKADSGTIELGAFVVMLASMSAMLWWDGRLKAQRDAMLAMWVAAGHPVEGEQCPMPWEVAGKTDPELLVGPVPKTALFPAAAAVIALVARASRGQKKVPGFWETAATRTAAGTFAILVAGMAQSKGYCQVERSIATGQTKVDIAA